jgi:sortase A
VTGEDVATPRPSRWDRPPPPHDWRWVVGNVGKVLIATGLLMFGFVAYQLWGTGLEYAQAQDRLDDEFAELLASVSTTTAPTTTTDPPVISTPTPTTTTTTAPVPTVPAFAPGDVVAHIEIPAIGLDAKVVSGVEPGDLKAGPGHYPDTPLPGQLGNAAIAGHRTTYGQPFYRLDEIAPGDEIVLTTVQGRFVYRMTSSEIVSASQSDVVATTDPTVARLTLTTCHPRYTAAQRLIVFAELDADASAAPQPAAIVEDQQPAEILPPATLPGEPATSTPASSSVPATTDPVATSPTVAAGDGPSGDVDEETADAFAHGWFSDDAAFAQVALWGFALTAIGIGSYLLSRRFRSNWVGLLAGILPFAVALYFFYQNVNRLLPAAL